MKKRKCFITSAVIVILLLWNQKPPEGIGMTNQFIGTYACVTIRNCYITVYDEGIFYYYIEHEGLYNKGYFREFAEDTYELGGKKVTPQRIKSDKRSFQFSDGEVELNFKKIDEIPMITETVLKLAE
ncbi:hypothetical protein [Anaerotignum sp.]|uniref:hypothetical protein n=1 Tax=Anaerotignum sp. TaxID=2039241 RepID=UPI00289FD049|nr:hypothetical protein [Anaerotignum sp.]